MPFGSQKIDHTLMIGDVYLELMRKGKVYGFRFEPQDDFKTRTGQQRKYCPDAFFGFGGRAYLLEMQLSSLSSSRWAEKWAVAQEFFDGGHHKNACWQPEGQKLIPYILVVTSQPEETVKAGSRLPFKICKKISDLF
jgi:hypothetical protein